MSDVDDLLRAFRADAPGPAEGAEERILARARRAALPPPANARPPRGGRRRIPALRWAAVPVALACVALVAVALSSSDGGPSLIERAEAAIASPDRIVELSTTVRSTTNASGVVNPHRTINMRQWTLRGAGRAVQFRILISEGPLGKPPTDEDSTVLSDRSGRIVDRRTWTPLFVRARDNYDYPRGGGRGELEIGLPGESISGPFTVVDRLREAYRSNDLKPVGHTAAGDPRFRLDLGPGSSCSRMEFVLDATTLLPRRIVNTTGSKPCGAAGGTVSREVWTVGEARSLPATAANRGLLAIGDWPTVRTVQEVAKGDPEPIDHAPPVPELDDGR